MSNIKFYSDPGFSDRLEHIEKIVAVTVVEKDLGSAIVTGGDIVKGIEI